MTKATHRRSLVDKIKQQKREQKKSFGLQRQNLTGHTSAAGGFTTLHQMSTSVSGGANTSSLLKRDGDQMLGPFAVFRSNQLFYPTSANNNTLDLSQGTGAYTSHWVWAESGSEPLEEISAGGGTAGDESGFMAGQLLFIENVETQTPTIKDASSGSMSASNPNIKTLDGNDYTFPSTKTIVLFMYTDIDGKWHQVSNPSGGVSLSGVNTWTGINAFTSGTSFSVTSPNIYLGDASGDNVFAQGTWRFYHDIRIDNDSGYNLPVPASTFDGYFVIQDGSGNDKRVPYIDP